MKLTYPTLSKACLGLIASFSLFSCSKDADLLSDYVINKDAKDVLNKLVVDDSFFVQSGETIVLDVLSNDSFEDLANVSITATTAPERGTVIINSDNTLTYSMEESDSTQNEPTPEDTFSYTAEEVQEDGSITAEQGTVSINTNKGKGLQVMFTQKQISLMIDRLQSGFSRPGTNGQDISVMINKAQQFSQNPSANRLDWMPSSDLEGCYRGCDPVPYNVINPNHSVDDNIFYAGIYAFILANRNETGDRDQAQDLANKIASQTLARAQDPNLDFSNRNLWLDGIQANPFFLTAAWIEKTMNNWSLIKSMNLVNNLSSYEEAQINDWFIKAGNWAYDKLSNQYSSAFGGNWRAKFDSTGWNDYQPGNSKSVVFVNGVEKPGYVLNHGAALIAWNTTSKYASLLHVYGLLYQKQDALELSERWFKDVFKLGVFPDGTSYELVRASSDIPSQGLQYWSITESQLVSMAHTHAVAVLNGNPIVQGKSFSELYDFTTNEGLSDLLPNYVGSDTKGGEKGLKKYLLAHAKYLGQSTGLNGWGEIRQVNQAPYPSHAMPTKFHYFVSMAQANAYYNNPDLKGLYSGTNGYQIPKTASEGADGPGAWGEAYMGGFGKWMVAFPYLETEGLYTSP